jgi:hypothetical protein
VSKSLELTYVMAYAPGDAAALREGEPRDLEVIG